MENLNEKTNGQQSDNGPAPEKSDPETGKHMWVINGYKIWAETYTQALELLPMIESF